MKTKDRYLFLMVLAVGICVSCSTTRNLPSGEQLYTGIRAIEVTDEDRSEEGDEAMGEVEAALACSPNNALPGSSTVRIPFPLGLWTYNAFVNKEGKLNQWIFRKFAAKPVLISSVNPDMRAKIAQNLLREHGYFDATVTSRVIPHAHDSLKAKVHYQLTMNQPSTYDSIVYRRIRHRADTLLDLSVKDRLLHPGDQFCVIHLEEERQRIASLMRDHGYYYFRPEYITYEADSTLSPHKISLRVRLKQGLPPSVLRPWKIGNITVNLYGDANEPPTNSLQYKDMTIRYEKTLRVKPEELYRRFRFRTGDAYSQAKQTKTQSELNRLGVFRYTETEYAPQDSSFRCDTLNVRVNAIYDLPLNGETEVNFTANSNKRIGPGAVFSLTKNNPFKRGGSLSLSLKGSYEWLVGGERNRAVSTIDNYEYGVTGTLTLPRVVLPDFFRREYDFPASTTFRLYADRLNRAEFFRLVSFGGSATYDFLPNPIRHHALTPLRLTFNRLERRTALFDSIAGDNRALSQSLKDQLIPAVSYTYTLDNASVREGRHTTWWQLSVTEAGNLISAAYTLAGESFNEPKKILGNPFAQFLKLTSELRYNHVLDRNHRLVGRIGGGVIYSYGNTTIAPYSEQFYVGGANSVRAFTIRNIGPGRYRPETGSRYNYLDHTGDLKLEGNAEYRFNMVGNLEGALFLDAGNVWMLRDDEDGNRSGGRLEWRHFLNDIAVGTGAGIRYNLDVLVLRLDIGIALHVPYDTGKKGYFNKTRENGLGFHLAVGYPF